MLAFVSASISPRRNGHLVRLALQLVARQRRQRGQRFERQFADEQLVQPRQIDDSGAFFIRRPQLGRLAVLSGEKELFRFPKGID